MRACLIVACALLPIARPFSVERKAEYRDEVREMFRHGYDGYMRYAYPADELRPLSCAPLVRDPNPANIGINDVHANASITLLDVLSTLPVILPEAFPDAVEHVATDISFDQDVKVQVFEMTIRALGALLATHQRLEALPDDPSAQAIALGIKGETDIKKHAKKMLDLALDLGRRLLPAFASPTGIPYARVNLRRGMEKSESAETCTAGAGSLVLEFTLLSRLTGDTRFEVLANRAYLALWNRRTPQDLLGNAIAASHGHWLSPGLSGIGAGMDSFFEYALKAAIMLDDSAYMDIFHDAYSAIQTYVRTTDGFIYRPVQMRGLTPPSQSVIDSLSAFFPGVMTLAGDLDSAIRAHLVFWNLWRRYDGIPESWEPETRQIGWAGWPGRPEFIESTYYLYKATGDDFYLRVGERVLRDIKRRTMTSCGFATLTNVETGEVEDRMESFMLSETLKYLYLLFDSSSSPISNTVFTTEGHPLSMPRNLTKAPTLAWRANHRRESMFCPAYVPPSHGGIIVGIEGRPDYDYARAIVFGPGEEGLAIEDDQRMTWGDGASCEMPSVPRFSFEIVLSPHDAGVDAEPPVHDRSPGLSKVRQDGDGDWVISNVDGLRLGVRWRLDGWGYDVASIGPHRVRQGQRVLVTDPKMSGYLPVPPPPPRVAHAPSDIKLHFAFAQDPSSSHKWSKDAALLTVNAATATFGRIFGQTDPFTSAETLWQAGGSTLLVVRPERHRDACSSLDGVSLAPDPDTPFALLVDRGECTFALKALNARRVGAVGLIIIDQEPQNIEAGPDGRINDEGLIRPSADGEPRQLLDEVEPLSIVFVENVTGRVLDHLLHNARLVVSAHLHEDDGHGAGPDIPPPGSVRHFNSSNDHEPREGRLVVGEWDIWNLRVVEPL